MRFVFCVVGIASTCALPCLIRPGLGQTIERGSGLFSDDAANPLRDYWHVIVPYCSSDTWAGTGFSQDTGYREYRTRFCWD